MPPSHRKQQSLRVRAPPAAHRGNFTYLQWSLAAIAVIVVLVFVSREFGAKLGAMTETPLDVGTDGQPLDTNRVVRSTPMPTDDGLSAAILIPVLLLLFLGNRIGYELVLFVRSGRLGIAETLIAGAVVSGLVWVLVSLVSLALFETTRVLWILSLALAVGLVVSFGFYWSRSNKFEPEWFEEYVKAQMGKNGLFPSGLREALRGNMRRAGATSDQMNTVFRNGGAFGHEERSDFIDFIREEILTRAPGDVSYGEVRRLMRAEGATEGEIQEVIDEAETNR